MKRSRALRQLAEVVGATQRTRITSLKGHRVPLSYLPNNVEGAWRLFLP